MNPKSSILIVGHDDIFENSLYEYFQNHGHTNVFSSSRIGLNTTIQPSVYEFFQNHRPEYVFLGSTRAGGIGVNQAHGAEFIYHNMESQNNVVYSAHKFGVKKLVYFAASCVYPVQAPQPVKEEALLTGEVEKTSEPYAIAKIAGIKLCQSYKKQYGLDTLVIVPATVYGPGMNTNPESAHVLGALIEKFAEAKKDQRAEVQLWGTGKASREFIYVDDFIDSVFFLMDKYKGERMINVGSGDEITIKDLAWMICEIIGYEGKISFDDSKPDGAMRKCLDNTILTKLDWKTEVSLKEGIQKTYEWYKEKNKA